MSLHDPGLLLEGVWKAFEHRTVLADVSLSVSRGCICSLVGPNGAGKSTLLNICLGYIPYDRGKITIAGANLGTDAMMARTKTAYVPDVARLYSDLSAVENVRYFESLRGVRATRAQIVAALERLRFTIGWADQPVRAYSKGMRQKVSLAMGVLKEAEVFLLDEPSSGLDAASVDELLKILRDLADEGKTILFSTHHSEQVDKISDLVAHIQDGRLSCDASAVNRAMLRSG